MSGTLYIVATPIGNREDITSRALKTLESVDAVICEDTRRTLPLLSYFGLRKRVVSYFEHSKGRVTENILSELTSGKSMALVTDAGTPGVSDPGARLVAQARRLEIPVVPIPGVSAVMTALSVAGLPTEPFHFWGFLSPKPSKRKKVYEWVQQLPGSHSFYVSPHKILKQAEEWGAYFSDFNFFVCKEMTKTYETFCFGKYEKVLEELKNIPIKGEFTVILSKEEL